MNAVFATLDLNRERASMEIRKLFVPFAKEGHDGYSSQCLSFLREAVFMLPTMAEDSHQPPAQPLRLKPRLKIKEMVEMERAV
jgi:hypothetical protein